MLQNFYDMLAVCANPFPRETEHARKHADKHANTSLAIVLGKSPASGTKRAVLTSQYHRPSHWVANTGHVVPLCQVTDPCQGRQFRNGNPCPG